ncbi:unnamed protein product [Fusarium equiseti]|uniref:Cyclochlorotine biosynthesis protein O n=1 Tax=Fusarium equiseti TaxID=61235 RepID=A0A8J2NEN9_FUSEQ|nr:unnamed protein product [Fusarium equiseti]
MDSMYHSLSLDDEQHVDEKAPLAPPTERYIIVPNQFARYSQRPWFVWACHGILLSLSLTFFASSLLLRAESLSNSGQRIPTYPYSPAESVAGFHTVRYNITPTTEETEFIGYGPEVDKAWEHITYDVGDQMITRDELDNLGLDPSSLTIKDPKTGKKGYRVGMQVFHQLHCLNLLRQSTYREYYSHTGGDIDVDHEDLRGHLDHCIEFLRTNLMCQSDTGVFAFKYYDGFEGHWPDFSTPHTCRNFSAIREWAFEHAVVFGDEE